MMTMKEREHRIHDAIAQCEAEGLSWTNDSIYRRVGGSTHAFKSAMKAYRARQAAPAGQQGSRIRHNQNDTSILMNAHTHNEEPVIIRELNGVLIRQWPDGSWDGTAMCKADGKQWGHYYENKATQKYIDVVESALGIPRALLVRSVDGGRYEDRGTRIHRRIAYHLAAWLSPETSYAMIDLLDQVIVAYAEETGQSPNQVFFDTILLGEKRKSEGFLPRLFVQHSNALTQAKKLGIAKTPDMKGPIHWAGDNPRKTRKIWEASLSIPNYKDTKTLRKTLGAKTTSEVVRQEVSDVTAGIATGIMIMAGTENEFYQGLQTTFGDGTTCVWGKGGPRVAGQAWAEEAKRHGWQSPQMDLFRNN